ncbi:MAG: alginate export family protein [Nitrospirales bacterium]
MTLRNLLKTYCVADGNSLQVSVCADALLKREIMRFLVENEMSIEMTKGKYLKRYYRERLLKIFLVSMMYLMATFFSAASNWSAMESHASSDFNLLGNDVPDRVRSVSTIPVPETADAVLVRTQEWKWNRYLKSALNLPDWVDLGLEHRTRFEVYDHPWRSNQPSGRTDPQIEQRSRLRVGFNGNVFKFLFEGQDSRTHLDDAGDFVTTAIVNETDILQLLVSATATNVLGTGLHADVHVGRMTMDFGHRRLVARNAFRNTTNAFDGIHGQLADGDTWRLRAFLVEPVIRDDVQLDEQSARNVFWGVYWETNQVPWLRTNLYYFGLNDQRSLIVAAQRTFSTFGARFYEIPQAGRLDYSLESIWQIGKRGNIDHFAHLQHVSLGYTFNLPWSPRFLISYDYASGDRNPTDGHDSAFDTLFGSRRFEYTPTGNFGPFFRTNISSPGWRLIVTPKQDWKLQLKHRIWYLATSRGTFGPQPSGTAANGSLRDASGGSGNFLGHDVETRIQWKINDNWNFDVGHTHWFKGSYFDRLPASAGLPPGGNKDTDYFYFETTFRL